MAQHFVDRLIAAVKQKGSPICVGIDPVLEKIPGKFLADGMAKNGLTNELAATAILNFGKDVIDSVHDLVAVVKPQIAFYELYGSHGMKAFEDTCEYAVSKGLLVIGDVKRGDIGTTAEAYADAYLSETSAVDAVTVNPYLGYDGVKPFIDVARKNGKGVFVLVKTSNKTSGDLQDRKVDESGLKIHEIVAHFVESWGADDIGENGYSLTGAVVGATYPAELRALREMMPNAYFLIPGYGAQGGTASDIKGAFNKDGLGALINASRSIIYAEDGAREAVKRMQAELGSV